MAKKFLFNLPGITCINCIQPVENSLSQITSLGLTYASSVTDKQILITIEDDQNKSDTEIISILKNAIDDVGVDCELVETEHEIIESEPTETQPLLSSSATKQKKKKTKNTAFRNHLIKGVIGTVVGVALIALTLSGVVLPALAMYLIVGGSSLLTLFLGAGSYFDAAKKLIKARTLTMDALFTVSTLTVVGVSIASFFVSWLPMMLEAGLLIFGFRHIGKAIEESIQHKVSSGLSFQSRAIKKLERKNQHDDSLWEACSAKELKPNDIIRIKKGDIIPVDGDCEDEVSSVYQTILTGSTIPAKIKKGDALLAGMRVPDDVDYLDMKVRNPASASYLSRLDKKMMEANQEKAPIETITNKILQYFVPAVLGIALVAGIVIGIFLNPALAIQCATSLLVSACPCTLGFITPLAVKIGMVKAIENGVEFKSGKALQSADQVDTVVFDLNGTLTTGVPVVAQHVILDKKTKKKDFFQYLSAIETHSKHPIAKAICDYTKQKLPANALIAEQIDQTSHSGMKAKINGKTCLVGNKDFLMENDIDVSSLSIECHDAEQVIFLVKENKIMGFVRVKDPLRKDAKFAIQELKRMGKDIHICTGADREAAERYAKELNIPIGNIFANSVGVTDGASARSKTNYIEALQAQGKKVAMLGDAANDALAITKSNFGLAIKSSAGDEITQQQAGAVVKNESLLPVVTAFAVAKQTVSSIKQNLVASLSYNLAMVVVAGTLLLAVGFALNPAIGVALMVLQTSLILLNLYRIKRQKLPHIKRYEQEMQNQNEPETVSTYGLLHQSDLQPEYNKSADHPSALHAEETHSAMPPSRVTCADVPAKIVSPNFARAALNS